MQITTISASVKTLFMKEIQKSLAKKSLSLVDTEWNVEVADLEDLIQVQGVNVFGIYDEAERKRLCELFIGNSVNDNMLNKIIWKLKMDDLYPDEKRVVAVKSIIEKTISIIRIMIVVHGGTRK